MFFGMHIKYFFACDSYSNIDLVCNICIIGTPLLIILVGLVFFECLFYFRQRLFSECAKYSL